MLQLGDIKQGSEIGRGGTHRRNACKYIWAECLDCHKRRWARLTKGKPRGNRCKSCARAGEQAYNWAGGKTHTNGYAKVRLLPSDFFYSMAHAGNYVLEHRLIMAQSLGRCLHSWEIVHHKNHIRDDNRIENLQLVSDDRHQQITILEKKIAKLEEKVDEQGKLIKLLQWQNKQVRSEVYD